MPAAADSLNTRSCLALIQQQCQVAAVELAAHFLIRDTHPHSSFLGWHRAPAFGEAKERESFRNSGRRARLVSRAIGPIDPIVLVTDA